MSPGRVHQGGQPLNTETAARKRYLLAGLVTTMIMLVIQQNGENLAHAISRPVSKVRVESAQQFITEAELTNMISRYLGASFSPLMSWEQSRALNNILGSGVSPQRNCGPTRWSWRFRKRLRLPDGVTGNYSISSVKSLSLPGAGAPMDCHCWLVRRVNSTGLWSSTVP